MTSEPKEFFIKQKLHRGGEECSVAEDMPRRSPYVLIDESVL